jgi:hypothetical protein
LRKDRFVTAERHKLRLAIVAVLGAVLIGVAVVVSTGDSSTFARAQPFHAQQVASKNWAGYVAQGKTFSSVSAAWVVPTANPNATGYSAFWVGLGGANASSRGLEQAGTTSNYVGGHATYYAWYEVLPAAEVPLNLVVHPGDHVAARVSVNGSAVTMSLSDLTSGRSAERTMQVTRPDTSSAEWIAEAPSQASSGGARVLPLADFGKATFTSANATAGGASGTVTDSAWRVRRLQLLSASARVVGIAHMVPGGLLVDLIRVPPSGDAVTSAPTGDGSSFTVVWRRHP